MLPILVEISRTLFLLIEIRVSKHWIGRLNRLELAGGDLWPPTSIPVMASPVHRIVCTICSTCSATCGTVSRTDRPM